MVSIANAQVQQEARSNTGDYTVSVRELKMSSRVRQWLSRAEKDFQRSDFTAALGKLDSALMEDPNCAQALTMRALIKLAAKDSDEAIADSKRATVLDANDPRAFLALATAFNAHQDFAEAEQAARRALRLDPLLWQARLEIAKSLYSARELLPALRELDELQIDFADVHLVRGDVLILLGRRQEAVDEFMKFLHDAPHDPRCKQVHQIVADTIPSSGAPL